MPLCSHKTMIEAEDRGDGTVTVRIRSSCEHAQHYAELLDSVTMDDLCEIRGSKILDLASEARITPTCLIPAGVYNACWLETGMISKNLVKTMSSICVHFLE